MKYEISRIFAVLLSLLVCGCAAKITKLNADKYYDAALQAEWAKDYELSKNMYYRSFVNARSSSASKEYISATLYGYGRMLAYTCDYAHANEALKESLSIEREVSGPVSANISKRLSELGRLSVAQGLNSEAANYFSEAVPMLEQLGLLESDPVGYAQYLEFYSVALKESGQSELAATTLKKSENIIAKNPQAQPKFVPVNFSAVCATVKKS